MKVVTAVWNLVKSNNFPYSTLAIVFVGLILVHPMFNQGYLLFVDSAIRIAESYYLIEELIPEGKLFGWAAPLGNAGMPIFTYDYPFGFMAIALLHFSTGLDALLSYKIVNFFAYIFPSLAIFYLLKSRINYKIALFFSILLLFQYDFVWFPMGGMWNQSLSIGFLVLFIHTLDKAVVNNPSVRKFLLLGFLLGLIFISHPFTSLFAIMFSAIAFPIYVIRRKIKVIELTKFLIISLTVAFAVSFFYIYPILLTVSEINPSALGLAESALPALVKSFSYLFLPHMRVPKIKEAFGWSSYAIDIDKILNNVGGLISASLLNFAEIVFSVSILIGIILYVKKKIGGDLLFIFGIVLLVNLFIASGLFILTPLKDLPLLNSIHSPRFFIYERVLLAFLAAYGIDFIIKNSKFVKIFSNKDSLLLLILTFSILYLSFEPMISGAMIQIVTSNNIKAFDDAERVWDWVTENVNETRVYYQDTYFASQNKQLNKLRIFPLSYKFTKVHTIGGWAINPAFHIAELDSSHMQIFGLGILRINDEQLAANMSYYNAKYAVSAETTLKDKLTNSKLFNKEAEFGEFTVFALKDYDQTWVMVNDKDANVKIVKFEYENIEFELPINGSITEIIVKMAYHPFWKAYVNSEPVEIRRLATGFKVFKTNGLISIRTDKTGYLNVKLLYEKPLPF